jgi:hypothetical protein
VTKDDRNLNLQPVPHPKLYRFFTFSLPKFNSGLSGLVKPVVFRSFYGVSGGHHGRPPRANTTKTDHGNTSTGLAATMIYA